MKNSKDCETLWKVKQIMGNCDKAMEEKNYGNNFVKSDIMEKIKQTDDRVMEKKVKHLKYYFQRKKEDQANNY